jgi:hypothetical protein
MSSDAGAAAFVFLKVAQQLKLATLLAEPAGKITAKATAK